MFGRVSKSLTISGARTLATAAAKTAESKAPLQLFGIHGRYATALYQSANKSGILNKVDEEVSAFEDVCSKNANFATYLANPTVSRSEKTGKLNTLLDEKKFSHITRNFFLTLAANGKLGEADKIIANFADLMRASKGQVVATITSAEALNKKTLETVQKAVLTIVGKGSQVEFKTRVNDSIMGGLQVKIGDKFIDLSLATRLQQVSADVDAIAV